MSVADEAAAAVQDRMRDYGHPADNHATTSRLWSADARSDAINVLDLVCDAVKIAIGVDDRWFSIRRLDWSVVKDDPQILVGVAQAVSEHHRVCSLCGSILPLAGYFGRNKHGRLGYGRECLDCRNAVRRKRSAAVEQAA